MAVDPSRESFESSNERHLENLNPPQREAVTHGEGPIVVLAGAGTGKTRVLTRRIAHLVLRHGVRPSSILAVTFTNKACTEMRERLKLLLGGVAERIWITTFHSAGLRILRRHAAELGYQKDFVVYDAHDAKEVLKGILKERNIDEKKFPVALFASFIDTEKNLPRFPGDASRNNSEYTDSLKEEVYDLYQRALRAANALDFGDLLALPHKLFREHSRILSSYQESLDFILVDEFQDTNIVQYEFVKMLAGRKRNILVVGDDDQSIYAFRGATIQNILHFEKDFPNARVVTLEQNYRSTSNILECAFSVIAKNKNRKPKKVWADAPPGSPVTLFCGRDESEEAHFIAREIKKRIDGGLTYQDVAVFYRTNAQSRALEEAFLSYRIPYRVFGGLKFYDRKEIKDIIAYLRLIANQSDNQAFLRIVNNPPRGIGAQTVTSIQDAAREEQISFFDAAVNFGKKNRHVAEFVKLIELLKGCYRQRNLGELVAAVIEKTEYAERLKILKNDPAAQSRLENLQELKGLAQTIEPSAEGEPLQQFLDRVALATTDDNPSETEELPRAGTRSNTVSFMTLHLAKGLEFDLVFFSGFEEGLVPHYKCMFEPSEIEEERRLCYVGITRARTNLFITRSRQRGMFGASGDGTSRFRESSRFAFDLPTGCVEDLGKGFFASFDSDISQEMSEDADEGFSGWGKRSKVKHRSIEEYARKYSSRELPQRRLSGETGGSNALPSLMSAEALEALQHLPLLTSQEAVADTEVVHPSFGSGIIVGVEGENAEEGHSLKVKIKFDTFEQEKKLVFRFAGLRKSKSP